MQMLELVIGVQRAVVRRGSLQEVFDAVTAGAHGLLGDEIVGLRLRDRADPSVLQVVSVYGLPERVAWRLWRAPAKGSGASGLAVLRNEVVVFDRYADSPAGIQELTENGVCTAMAAPVRDGGVVIGSLVVASRRPGRAYTATDRGLLAPSPSMSARRSPTPRRATAWNRGSMTR